MTELRTGRLGFTAIILSFIAAACSNPSTGLKAPAESPAPAESTSPESVAHAVVGHTPPPKGGSPTIVVLASRAPREFPPQAERPYMDQVSLTFIPSVLFVRTRQPAEFRNSDSELHNVRVREEATKAGTFNVAIPAGEVYLHTFERDGFYDVGCDIHPGMFAQILATSTPYTAVADSDGNFAFPDVAPGSYTITVYAGTKQIERPVEVAGARTEINLVDD